MAGSRAIDYVYRILDRFSPQLERMKRTAASFDARMSAGFKNLAKDTEKYQERIGRLGRFMRTGLVLAAGVAITGIGVLAHKATQLWSSQSEAIANVDATLQSTGGTVGRTLSQIEAQAASLQQNTFFGDEDILKGVSAQLLTFTNIAGNSFDRTQAVVLDVTAKLNGLNASESALQSTSIMLGKALNDPVANLGALGRAGIQFSEDQKELIKKMWKAGNQAGAQSMILAELEKQYGGTAAALAQTTEGISMSIKNTQGDMMELIGKGIDPFRKTILQAKSDTLNSLMPIIDKFTAWTSANEDLINSKITAFIDGAKSALAGLVGSFKIAYKIISAVVKVLKILSPILIPLVAAFVAYQATMYTAAAAMMVYNAVQVVQNALLTANPVGLVIAGFAALIAIVVIVIKYWDQITAAIKRAWTWFVNFYDTIKGIVAIYGGPMVYAIAAVIDMIRSLINNFDEIKAAFTDGGFVAGIKAIGSALLDGLIAPALSFLNVLKSIADKIANWGVFQAFVEIAKTIPGLILQYWQPIMDFFTMLIDKIGAGVGKVRDFFGGVGEKLGGFFGFGGEEVPTAPMPSAAAPIPMGYAANANAEASVSVYTEQGMRARPFSPRGNLGYNMSSRSAR